MTRHPKVAIVGPVPPIRSGIARHTLACARGLASLGAEPRIWSFARQYPARLYPGQSEVSPDLAPPSDLPVSCKIDGINPATWRRAAREIADWQPDLVVFPAWTFFLAPALGSIAGRLRARGVPTCALVHNAFDHEAAWWKTRLSLWHLARADRFVTHNTGLADELRRHFPGRPVSVFPHPVFDDFPPAQGTLPRQAGLELLFFGLVRPYKGLDIAIDALDQSGRRDVRLTIAGEFWHGLDEVRADIARRGLADRIDLRPGHVSDADTAELFQRCDAVVLPYRSVTGSGIVPLAYHYGRAVLASDLPGLASTIRHGETGLLFPAADSHALAALITGLTRDETDRLGRDAAEFGKTLSWPELSRRILYPDTIRRNS